MNKPPALLKMSLCAALALAISAPAVRANVYATDIEINGVLTNSPGTNGTAATITYHLNDNASGGVTVTIWQGSSSVASFPGTTNAGLNSVSWTPSNSGTYGVSIKAGSTGYSTWQQISPLTTNFVAVYPLGLAVDKNAASPYYGRVIVSCGTSATANGVTQSAGLYKFNADGTPADEGSFGYANYTTNDGGIISTGEMPAGTFAGNFQWANPSTVRIGEDDRIYWQDNSFGGAIVACDMLATTNEVVLSHTLGSYANCPDLGLINNSTYGWLQFDVINTGVASAYSGSNGVYTGGQAALFLSDWDYPCAGIWMWHLVGQPGGMVADPTDTFGQQAVAVGNGADALTLRSDGVAVDNNLDLVVGETRNNAGDPAPRTACWTNWNGGALPPGDQDGAQGGGFNYSETAGAFWTEGGGSSSATDRDVFDVVLNSKSNPTLLARAHTVAAASAGIDLLIPFNPTVTITGVSISGSTLTINCVSSSPYAPAASQLSLYGSSTVNGQFSLVSATFTGGNGVFQATTTATSAIQFYVVGFPSVAGASANGPVVTIKTTGNEADTMSSIDTGIYYSGIAFDNVGNLYGGNASDNYWRVWSPPGPNTNSTQAVATLTVPGLATAKPE